MALLCCISSALGKLLLKCNVLCWLAFQTRTTCWTPGAVLGRKRLRKKVQQHKILQTKSAHSERWTSHDGIHNLDSFKCKTLFDSFYQRTATDQRNMNYLRMNANYNCMSASNVGKRSSVSLAYHDGKSKWIICQFLWFQLNELKDWIVEELTDLTRWSMSVLTKVQTLISLWATLNDL